MRDQELEKIIGHIDAIKWGLTIVMPAVFMIIGLVAKYVAWQIKKAQEDFSRRIQELFVKISDDMEGVSDKINDLDDKREENRQRITAIEHDIKGLIEICKERHGK